MQQANSLPDFRAVILDLDGLILDTEAGYFRAWQQAARAMGYNLPEDFCRGLSGRHYQEVERLVCRMLGPEFQLQEFRRSSGRYWRELVNRDGIAIKEGFFSLFKVLQQFAIPYCLATNSLAENASECLEFAGLQDHFPLRVCRDNVARGKPAPDLFLYAAKTLGVAIGDCLIVEDSVTGIAAAAQTGAFGILIPSQAQVEPQTRAMADLLLPSLTELAALLARHMQH